MSRTTSLVLPSGAPQPPRGPRRKNASADAGSMTSGLRALHYWLPSPASVGVTPLAVDAPTGAARNVVPFPLSPEVKKGPRPLREVNSNVQIVDDTLEKRAKAEDADKRNSNDWPVQILRRRAQSCLARSYMYAQHIERKTSPPSVSDVSSTPPAVSPHPSSMTPAPRPRVSKWSPKPQSLLNQTTHMPMRAAPARPPRHAARRTTPAPPPKRPMSHPNTEPQAQKPPPAAARRRARDDLHFVALIRRSVLWNMQERLRLLEARARADTLSSATSSEASLSPPLSPSSSTSSVSSASSLGSSADSSGAEKAEEDDASQMAAQAFAADVALVTRLSARLAAHGYAPTPADRLLLRCVRALLDPVPPRYRVRNESESEDEADDECDMRRRGLGGAARPAGTYGLCQVVASMTLRRRDRMAVKGRVPTVAGIEARARSVSRLRDVVNAASG
jgi:hypothetical protein